MQVAGVVFAGAVQVPGGVEGFPDGGGLGAFGGGEIPVAAAQGQAVGFADNRGGDDLNRIAQIPHQTLEDFELLVILLAKHGTVGADDVEQLRNNGADAAKVAGTAFPFQAARDLHFIHPCRNRVESVRIHFGIGRREDVGGPGLFAEGAVGF